MISCTLTVGFCYLITASVHNRVVWKSPVHSHLNFKVEVCFVFATFLYRLLLLDTNSSPEMFIKETNSTFCLSNNFGTCTWNTFLVYRSGNALQMPRTLLIWPIKSISFLCDRHSKVLLTLFCFLNDGIACIWNFLFIIKLSKILMLKQYLERC